MALFGCFLDSLSDGREVRHTSNVLDLGLLCVFIGVQGTLGHLQMVLVGVLDVELWRPVIAAVAGWEAASNAEDGARTCPSWTRGRRAATAGTSTNFGALPVPWKMHACRRFRYLREVGAKQLLV